MPQLILHVGHGKTGSSALQAFFARNVERLRDAGVIYPVDESVKAAAKGAVTSGNGTALMQWLCPATKTKADPASALPDIASHARNGAERILLSNEGMCWFRREKMSELLAFCAAIGVEVRVVFYVRHVANHALSTYGQRVRAKGLTYSFRRFLEADYKFPFRATIENLVATLPRSAFAVKLYDDLRHDLACDFARTVLGIDAGFATVEIINRSASREEMKAMAVRNRQHASPAEAWAANKSVVPDGDGRSVFWADELAILEAKARTHIDFVNSYLPDSAIALMSPDAVVNDGSEP